MSLELLAHRVIGEFVVHDPDQNIQECSKVARIIACKTIPSGQKIYILAECMNFDGDISSEQDQATISENGDSFPDLALAIQEYNQDNFDPRKFMAEEDWDLIPEESDAD